MKRSLLALASGLLLSGIFTSPSRADSPITSTPFSDAYQDYEIVQQAQKAGVLNLEMAQYLSSKSAAIDVKAAVINALSWNIDGKQNATLYRYFLALSYGTTIEKLNPRTLTSDETFALGYLTVMDDYFHPEKAVPLLKMAKAQRSNSLTVAMIAALVQAQAAFDSDWCKLWMLTNGAANDTTLKQDLRPEAKKIILDYMNLYRSSCN
jgi:hypothetical protein